MRILGIILLWFLLPAGAYAQNLIYFKGDNAKYGYLDANGEIAIEPKYDYVDDFSEGLAVVGINGKRGFINSKGDEVIPCTYYNAYSFSNGLAMVAAAFGKWGIIDKDGKEIIPLKYSLLRGGQFPDGLIAATLGGKWGFLDIQGELKIPMVYDETEPFSDGLANVMRNGKWGYINKNGKEVIPVKYDNAYSFSDGLGAVQLNGKWGFVDATGREVVPLAYDYVHSFSEGLAGVKRNKQYGFIDATGKEIIPPKYASVNKFSGGIAIVAGPSMIHEWGLIDSTGKELTPLKYSNIYGFNEGVGIVEVRKKYGFIDATGKELTPQVYTQASSFRNGIAKVTRSDGKPALLNKFFKETYMMDGENSDYIRSVKANKTGVLDRQKQLVVPYLYDTIYALNIAEGLATAKNTADNDYTYLNLAGGQPYNWALGDSLNTYQLQHNKIVLYKHSFKKRPPGLGLKSPEGKVLLYPVFSKIEVKQDKILCEVAGVTLSFDAAVLGAYKIVFKDNDRHSCPDCDGNGYTSQTVRVAASAQPVTTRSYSTTSEKVWDPKTNSYKDVKGIKETTTTQTKYTRSDTYEERTECRRCDGRGRFQYMIWNIVQFRYVLY